MEERKKNLGICGRERKKEENGEILGRWSFAREQKRKGWLKDPLVHEKLLGIHVQILEQSKKNNKRKKEEGLRCGGSGGGGWWDMEFLSSDFQWFYWLSKLLHKIRIQRMVGEHVRACFVFDIVTFYNGTNLHLISIDHFGYNFVLVLIR